MSPASALVHVGTAPGGEYRLVLLADGSSQETLADHLAAQGIDGGTALDGDWPKAWSDTHVLLGPPDGTTIDTTRDRLLLVDLASLSGQLLPFPDVSEGTDSMNNSFRLDANGNPYLVGSQDGHDIVLSAFTDGMWNSDAGAMQIEPTVDFELLPPDGQTPRLIAVDGAGNTLWRRDDITSEPHEGFRTGRSGDVTVVSGCIGTYTDFVCDAPALVGVASTTGETQWVLDGQRAVVALADGYALITDAITDSGTPAGWLLVDTNTGLPVSGQRWEDPGTFQQECCGGEEFWFVRRDGGVIIAGHETELAIWYPSGSGLAAHTLSLP
jgi:hypothetical protein